MEAKCAVLISCVAIMGLTLMLTPDAGAALSAGAAKVVITPPLEEFPEVSLGGFGARQGKPAQGVHDPLYSNALVLSDGQTKIALVSTDLLMITPEMKEAVVAGVADLGLSAATVLVAATHSHSAPECMHPAGDLWPLALGRFNPALVEWTTSRIAASIRAADAALEPARLGIVAAPIAGLSRNRRATGEGLLDPTMTVIKVVPARAEAPPLAAVVNFTAHPTMMGADSFLYSAEWPGAANAALEMWMGRGSVSLFFNGAQGDQTAAGDFGSGWQRVAAYGNAIAKEAWKLASDMPLSDEVALSAALVNWELPPPRVSPAFMGSTGQEYGMGPAQAEELFAALFPRRVALQALRVGDAVLMAVPGEAIAELGLQMRADATRVGARYPMVIGLANDYLGYILSHQQYQKGGYESGTSFYGPQLGPILVAQMKQATVRALGR